MSTQVNVRLDDHSLAVLEQRYGRGTPRATIVSLAVQEFVASIAAPEVSGKGDNAPETVLSEADQEAIDAVERTKEA